MVENVATPTRELRFAQSLRDWGFIFMLTIWMQSIMVSAIATKGVGYSVAGTIRTPEREYFERRNRLMKKDMSTIWKSFLFEFPFEVTEEERCTADMIILVRNQLAHCFISSGREFSLFLPSPGSNTIVDELITAGWIEKSADAASDPQMLVMREGDRQWFDKNKATILNFLEHTILRVTRAHGIEDKAIC